MGATPVEAEVLRAAAAAAAPGGLPLVDVKSAELPAGKGEPPVAEETVDAPPADAATAAAEAAAALEAATAAMSRVDAVVAQRQARRDARARRQAGALEIEVDAEVEEAEAEAEAAEAALAAKKAETEAAEEAVAAAKAKTEAAEEAAVAAAVAAALADSPLHVTAVDVRSERLHTSAALPLPRRAITPDGHTLELNPDHPLVVQLAQGVTAEEGEDVVRERAELLAQLGAVAAGVGAVNQAAPPSGSRERRLGAATAEATPRRGRRVAAARSLGGG